MTVQITRSLAIPERELTFEFTRSGGPGGQNVNKVSSRVELVFDVGNSSSLSPEEKDRLFAKLHTRIDGEGRLRVASQESRSQWRNRELVVARFVSLLRNALKVKKKRVATKPTRSSKAVRTKQKKAHSAKKRLRGKVSRFEE